MAARALADARLLRPKDSLAAPSVEPLAYMCDHPVYGLVLPDAEHIPSFSL